MTKIQQTLDFQGKIVNTQKAIIQYDPYKRKQMYFVPRTGKSYVVSSKNKHKLFSSGDLELKGELFINGRFVKDNAKNRAKLNQENKIKNPVTNRWIKDTKLNRKKIIELNKKKVLEEIRSIRENKASKIITSAMQRVLKPRLEETTYKSYFKYTIPSVLLRRVGTLDIGSLTEKPDIVMASMVYNLFKKTMQHKLIELGFCRVFVSFELKLHKPDGTEIIWKRNLGRMDIGNLSDFWHYLYKYFTEHIE